MTTPVTATIGGVDASVSFAGLAPGFVGLYQVNAMVPGGVVAGPAVPVVITQDGIASNTVTIAVQTAGSLQFRSLQWRNSAVEK